MNHLETGVPEVTNEVLVFHRRKTRFFKTKINEFPGSKTTDGCTDIVFPQKFAINDISRFFNSHLFETNYDSANGHHSHRIRFSPHHLFCPTTKSEVGLWLTACIA